MLRSVTADTDLSHEDDLVAVSGKVLRSLIMRAAAEKGPAQKDLRRIASKIDIDSTIHVGLKTSLVLLNYSEGIYNRCSKGNCDKVLTLAEAISGRVACADHREVTKMDSRKARKKKKALIKDLEEFTVRGYISHECPGG